MRLIYAAVLVLALLPSCSQIVSIEAWELAETRVTKYDTELFKALETDPENEVRITVLRELLAGATTNLNERLADYQKVATELRRASAETTSKIVGFLKDAGFVSALLAGGL